MRLMATSRYWKVTFELMTTFVHEFAEVLAWAADRRAIECSGDVWSYRDLDEASGRIATRMRSVGLKPHAVVGVELSKSPRYIAALLGVWRCGCVAMPLPPDLPTQRRQELLRHSHAALRVDDEFVEQIGSEDISSSSWYPNPADPAYLIYTSGSTGFPKGVLVSHSGLVPVLVDQIDTFGLDETTRSLLYLSTAFDASLSDIGTVLLAGGTLVIEPDCHRWSVEELFRRIESLRISYCDLPPSLLSHAARLNIASPRSLLTIVMGGEVCDFVTIKYWSDRVNLFNVFGPTEATICTSIHRCDPIVLASSERQEVPIGQPVAGMVNRVAEDDELWICGQGLAIEYLDQPELTAEKFVLHDRERWYRTGDRVAVDSTGDVYFRGRMDRQFKCMGRLIEPAEIEHRLLEDASITSAAVLPIFENDGIVKRFVAAIELGSEADCEQIAVKSASRRLGKLLPPWMVPSTLIPFGRFPRTVSYKPDLSRIRQQVERFHSSGSQDVPPELDAFLIDSEPARMLREVWQQVLGRPVQWKDRFCEVGGDSLSAMTVLARMRSLNWTLSPEALLQKPLLECASQLNLPEAMSSMELTMIAEQILNESDLSRGHLPAMRILNESSTMTAASSILLTGATGFLGTWLLEELSKHLDQTIVCIVRAGSPDEAMDRLQSSRRRFLGANCDLLPSEHAEVICGDVSEPMFGLSETQWSHLCNRITDVVHLAADVHLLRSFEQMLPVNLSSVATAMQLCRCGIAKRLHYASTLSVFVASDRKDQRFDEADRLDDICHVHGGYGQSKFAAENLIWSCDLPFEPSVLRFGLLTGDRQRAIGPSNDQLTDFTRGLTQLGMYPASLDEICFDATPVDQAARIACHLIINGSTGAWHICSDHPVTLRRWVDAIRCCGVQIEGVENHEFLQHIRRRNLLSVTEAMSSLSLSRRLLAQLDNGFSNHHQMDLFLASDGTFDCTRTRQQLRDSKTEIPFASDELLKSMVGRMLGQVEVTS